MLEAAAGSVLQKDTPLYSGATQTGLTPNGSYDRMIYLDRSTIQDAGTLRNLIADCVREFENSLRSRLVLRVLSSASESEIQTIRQMYPSLEMSSYPDSEGRFQYCTFALNKARRQLIPEQVARIQDRIRSIVQTPLHDGSNSTFEEFARQQLDHQSRQQNRLTTHIDADQLHTLWQPFGWDLRSCRDLLEAIEHDRTHDRLVGLLHENRLLIGVAMYSDQSHMTTINGIQQTVAHGESTEWAILPQFRHHNAIVPLLIGLHSYLIHHRIGNVYADLRCPDPDNPGPHSLSAARKSGFNIPVPDHDGPFASINHVTIGGAPDTSNRDRFISGLNAAQLRSFALGYLNHQLLSPEVRQYYLNQIES